MKNKLLVGLISLSFYTYGQTKCKERLLLTSKDITKSTNDTVFIRSIRHSLWTDSVIVNTINKVKKVYAANKVWGYQDFDLINGCLTFRNFNEEFYKVREIGSLIIYSQTSTNGKMAYSSYYFSKTLDSPIYSLKWRNVKEQFEDNPCFLEKLDNDLKWYQSYENIDRETDKFRFIEFYDACK
jgi:hypothetical protein